MNKIKVVDDNLDTLKVSKDINVEYIKKEGMFSINELKIAVNKSSKLEIEIKLLDNTKLDLSINILDDVELNLNIITKGNSGKIKYNYNLYSNSKLDLYKFENVTSVKEMININLNKENASINYNFKTIGNSKETYDYYIYHKANNTNSNLKNNAICIDDGVILYQVSSYIPKDIIGCTAVQNNRIINLTDNKCEIKPNLYIDSSDVSASHSALIGKFSDDEIFYIESRGIDYNKALKLLISGFLTSDIGDKKILKEINSNIEKYWR